MKAGVVEPIACANETGMNFSETLPRTTAAQKVAASTATLERVGPGGDEEEEEMLFSFSATAEEEELLFFSRLCSQGWQILPSSAHAPMCSSVSSKGRLKPKLESRARFISRMPVLAAYQAATTRKVRTESREKREVVEGVVEEEEGGGAKEVFVVRWREEDDDDEELDEELKFSLPKKAATELASDDADIPLTRPGDRGVMTGGGGRNDDGEGFSWRATGGAAPAVAVAAEVAADDGWNAEASSAPLVEVGRS